MRQERKYFSSEAAVTPALGTSKFSTLGAPSAQEVPCSGKTLPISLQVYPSPPPTSCRVPTITPWSIFPTLGIIHTRFLAAKCGIPKHQQITLNACSRDLLKALAGGCPERDGGCFTSCYRWHHHLDYISSCDIGQLKPCSPREAQLN